MLIVGIDSADHVSVASLSGAKISTAPSIDFHCDALMVFEEKISSFAHKLIIALFRFRLIVKEFKNKQPSY